MDKGLLLHREVVCTSQLIAVNKSPHRYPENWTSCYLQYVTLYLLSNRLHSEIKNFYFAKFLSIKD